MPVDLELWLTGFTRGFLAADGLAADVSNKEPAEGDFPEAVVVIRDDGGAKLSLITSQRSVGVSVLAGTRLWDKPAKDLARVVFSVLTDDDLPIVGGSSCPIASVDEHFGPYTVAESQDRTRVYFTVTYTVVGSPVG